MSDNKSTKFKSFQIIFRFFKDYPKSYLAILLLMVLGRGLATIWPTFLKDLVNNFSQSMSKAVIQHSLVLFFIAYALSEICLRFSSYISVKPMIQSVKNLKLKLFSRVIDHSTYFVMNQSSGKLSSKVEQICSSAEALIDMFLWVFFSIFINVVVTSVLLAKSNLIIASIFCSWVVLYLFFLRKVILTGDQRWQEAANQEAQISGKMVDVISNILTIKAFSGRQKEHSDFKKKLDVAYEKIQKASFFSIHSYTFQELSTTILGISLLSSSYFLYRLGKITGGEIIMILSLYMMLKDKLHSLGSFSKEFFKQYGKLKSGIELLNIPLDIQDSSCAKDQFIESFDIEFKNIFFGYPSGKRVFEDLNCIIHKNEKVGIVGKSGAGKSTLLHLLMRLYEINSGAISFNKINIKEFSQESLRNHISIVPQEPILFHRSILDNILYGNLTASSKEIMRAIQLSNCQEFIEELPEKEYTIVGERGVNLSGGQRQRVAIARAILKNAPIVVFDEPTSALDSQNEGLIQNLFTQMFVDKTVIVFTHQLATLNNFDRVFLLQDGKLLETSHEKFFVTSKF